MHSTRILQSRPDVAIVCGAVSFRMLVNLVGPVKTSSSVLMNMPPAVSLCPLMAEIVPTVIKLTLAEHVKRALILEQSPACDLEGMACHDLAACRMESLINLND
jgi:hypothetical protein